MANHGSKIKILSLNCNGLNNKLKRTSVLSWLASNHKGLTFLQETHSSEAVELDWNKYASDYNIWYSHGTNRARGVCTMIPKQLSYKVVKQISDENGRFLLLHTFIDNSEFVLVNLYAPTKDNPEEQKLFLNFVREHLCHFLGKRIIMGGDFNIYMNPELDKKGGICEKQSECSVILQDLVDELNLCDIYRLQNPDQHRYTWRNKGRNGWVHSRLDMFLVSQDLQFQKIKALIHPGIKSDHSLIEISFVTSKDWVRGKGFYKFNTTLLKDKFYVDMINKEITELENENKSSQNKALFWDYCKCKFRGLTISYSSFKSKQQKMVEAQLSAEVESLEQVISETPSPDLLNRYQETKQLLEEIHITKAKGHLTRSRAQDIEENEKCSKYFCQSKKGITILNVLSA